MTVPYTGSTAASVVPQKGWRMSIPSEPVPVPGVVAEIEAGRPVAAVWVNELCANHLPGGRRL